MPYNLFFTMRRSNEFTKAKAVYVGQAGQSEPVMTIEDPEFSSCLEVFQTLLKAVAAHMEVRREAQRRG